MAIGINAIVGLNNFSWLVAYLSYLVAFYSYQLYITDAIDLAIEIKSRILGWQKAIWLASSVALILIYWFAIRLSPEWPSRIPRSEIDVIFQSIFFVVVTIASLTIAWGTYIYIKQEQDKFLKLQSRLSLAPITTGSTCFILKIIFLSLWLYNPQSSWLSSINQLAQLAMGTTALLALSNLVIIPIAPRLYQLFKAFLNIPAWFDLLDLQNKLYRHQLIKKPPHLSLLQYLTQPNYYMLKIIVEVLDVQRSQGTKRSNTSRSKRKLQEAISNLDKNLQYEELIKACRKINK